MPWQGTRFLELILGRGRLEPQYTVRIPKQLELSAWPTLGLPEAWPLPTDPLRAYTS